MNYLKYTIITLTLIMSLWANAQSDTKTSSSNTIMPPANIQAAIKIQGGPGIAISGTSTIKKIPTNAQKIISTDYPNTSITNVSENYIKQTYTVTLNDGTIITINSNGKITNIKAPRNTSLPNQILADILPPATSIHLAEAGLLNSVNEVKHIQDHGTMVMILDTPTPHILYDIDGTFVITYY